MKISLVACGALLVPVAHGAGLASQMMAVCATAGAAASVEGRGGDFRSHTDRALKTRANSPPPTPGMEYSWAPTAAPTGFPDYGDDDDVYSYSYSYDMSFSPTPAPVEVRGGGGGGGPGDDADGALGSEADTAAADSSVVEDDSDGSDVGTILLVVILAFVVGAALVLFRSWRKRRSSWQALGNNEALLP